MSAERINYGVGGTISQALPVRRPEASEKDGADFASIAGACQWMNGAAAGAVGVKEAPMHTATPSLVGFAKAPWNKGRLTGQQRPLKPKEVWMIRVRLQLERRRRDLALFNLAVDSKLRGCDLVRLRVNDVCVGGRAQDRATVIQRKTGRSVQFEITEQTRTAIQDWLGSTALGGLAIPVPEPSS